MSGKEFDKLVIDATYDLRVTVREIASWMEVDTSTLWRLRRRKRVPAYYALALKAVLGERRKAA